MSTMPKKLSGENMKNELWENMMAVKNKKLTPEMANSIATQSREIMRIVKVEILINNSKPGDKIRSLL